MKQVMDLAKQGVRQPIDKMKIKTLLVLTGGLFLPQFVFCETSHLVPLGWNVLAEKEQCLELSDVVNKYMDRSDTLLACVFFSARSQGHTTAVRVFKNAEGYCIGVIAMPSTVEQTQPIDEGLAKLIERLWSRELLLTRAVSNDDIRLDSSPAVFLGRGGGRSLIVAMMPNNPQADCGPLIMDKVADLLIQYVRNPDRRSFLDEVKAAINK